MPLAQPNIPYRSIRDLILKNLRDSKASLNSGLSLGQFQRDIEQIKSGDYLPLVSKNALFPTILVKIMEKNEEWKNIGNAGRKRPVIQFKIIGVVKNVLTSNEADNDIMQLTGNIEGIFRNNIQVDDTVLLWSQPTRAVFNTTEVFEGQYFDIVLIDLECVCEIK